MHIFSIKLIITTLSLNFNFHPLDRINGVIHDTIRVRGPVLELGISSIVSKLFIAMAHRPHKIIFVPKFITWDVIHELISGIR